MACAVSSESDLLSCSSCSWIYDDEVRKPKNLPCSHSICLPCLKDAQKSGSICCPVCDCSIQNLVDCDVTEMPNNNYILHILDLQSKMKVFEVKKTETETLINSCPRWCLSCHSHATVNCYDELHSCIDMTSNKCMKNLKDLLWLKEELKKDRELDQASMKNAIGQRKDIKNYLWNISEALTSCLKHVKNLQEENNVALGKLVAALKTKNKKEQQEEDSHSTELLSLLTEFSSRENTRESLKKKFDSNFAQPFEDNIASAGAQMAEIEKQKTTFVTVKLPCDEKDKVNSSGSLKLIHQINPSHFWNGNSDKAVDLESNAASISIAFLVSRLAYQTLSEGVIEPDGFDDHFILPSLLAVPSVIHTPPSSGFSPPSFEPMPTSPSLDTNNLYSAWGNSETCLAFHNAVVSPVMSPLNYESSSRRSFPSPSEPVSYPPAISNDRFIMGKSKFIMHMFKGMVQNRQGEVHIRSPMSSLHSGFIEQLFSAIASKPHCFSITLEKVVVDVYVVVTFAAINPQQSNLVVNKINVHSSRIFEEDQLATKSGEVGVTLIKTDPLNRITGWSLVFPLSKYANPANAAHVLAMPPAFLLGSIVNPRGFECVQKITRFSQLERNKLHFSLQCSSV